MPKETDRVSGSQTHTENTIWSAGGVVMRRCPQGTHQVALCGRTAEGLWALPKGTPDGSESPLETAVREVSEETGLEVQPGPKVGNIQYPVKLEAASHAMIKTVFYYLMTPVGGDFAKHDDEFDQVQWFETGRALQVLTHRNEARIVEKALALAAL